MRGLATQWPRHATCMFARCRLLAARGEVVGARLGITQACGPVRCASESAPESKSGRKRPTKKVGDAALTTGDNARPDAHTLPVRMRRRRRNAAGTFDEEVESHGTTVEEAPHTAVPPRRRRSSLEMARIRIAEAERRENEVEEEHEPMEVEHRGKGRPKLRPLPEVDGNWDANDEESRRAVAVDLRERRTALGVPKSKSSKVQIASGELCDDIIKRLRPSLQKHVGCDLIDLNPGIGLWSRHLHEALKPRSHILIEPQQDLFRGYLDPLLEKPGVMLGPSRASSQHRLPIDDILNSGLLPHQKAYASDDPRLDQPNHTLLIIANFAWQPRQRAGRHSSVAQFMLHSLVMAVRARALIHKFGLVRMLLWTHEADMDSVLPSTVASRRTLATIAEAMCEDVTAVCAGDPPGLAKYARMPLDRLQVGRKVMERMEKSGIDTPPHRETTLMKVLKGIEAGTMTPERYAYDLLSVKYAGLEERYYDGGFVLTDEKKIKPPGRTSALSSDPSYTTLMNHRSRRRIRLSVMKQAVISAADQASVDREWMTLDSLPEKEREQRRAALQERRAVFHRWIEKLPLPFRSEVIRWLEDLRVTANDPPLLLRDRRAYEPLLIHPAECIPSATPVLLDIQPGAAKTIRHRDEEYWEVFHALAASSRRGNSKTLRESLRSFPGAYEWCIPRCPSLTNTAKGGCGDLEHLSVRCLTQEMLHELTTTWLKWPLKPERMHFLSNQGIQQDDGDEWM